MIYLQNCLSCLAAIFLHDESTKNAQLQQNILLFFGFFD